MKSFKYMGKFHGENTLPTREHPDNCVIFKEPDNMKKFALLVNGISLIIAVIVFVLFFLRASRLDFLPLFIACIASLIACVPHEFLHALLMPGDVMMYQNLKQGMLFVISLDDMTKGQFIFMSLFPTIIFGFIPYLIFLIFPDLLFLGFFGALSISMGAGDFFNVFSAATQVPTKALIYMSGMHSYWYNT